jgi:hypothetical protein
LVASKMCQGGIKARICIDGFPKVHEHVSGVVQISQTETVPAIPRAAEDELRNWVGRHGDARENLIRCRE